jgi:hypothetical protein
MELRIMMRHLKNKLGLGSPSFFHLYSLELVGGWINDERKKPQNQRVDLTVKTPVDSVRVYVHGRSPVTLGELKDERSSRPRIFGP